VSYQTLSEGRLGVVAVLGGGSGRLLPCFAGHLDTVPPGGAAWRSDLFGRVSTGVAFMTGVPAT
jgi:acetylornithine deacetylase/succinyl-diaminopimelate desuccinylase-like protein